MHKFLLPAAVLLPAAILLLGVFWIAVCACRRGLQAPPCRRGLQEPGHRGSSPDSDMELGKWHLAAKVLLRQDRGGDTALWVSSGPVN
jgi:hypothetical protein